jgi:hypothetical protein
VPRDKAVQKVQSVRWANRVLRATLGRRDQQAHRVSLDRWVTQGPSVLQDWLVPLDHQDRLDSLARRDLKEVREPTDCRV